MEKDPLEEKHDNSEEDGSNPREAWTISTIKPSKADSLKMLLMIGKVSKKM